METTTIQLPSVTDVTNGIEVFMYDVVEYNSHQATFWNSVAKFANNIIDSVKSAFDYCIYITDAFAVMVMENPFPACVGTVVSLSIFFLILDFARNRGG